MLIALYKIWLHVIQYYLFLKEIYHVYHYPFFKFVHCIASKSKGNESNVSETDYVRMYSVFST